MIVKYISIPKNPTVMGLNIRILSSKLYNMLTVPPGYSVLEELLTLTKAGCCIDTKKYLKTTLDEVIYLL